MLALVDFMAGVSKPYEYIAYIDEAGDFGLRRVAPIDGVRGSEWLVMGAVVIRASNETQIIRDFRALRNKANNIQAPYLHFRDLNEWQKKVVCDGVVSFPVRLFTVISNKQNMRKHRNDAAARVSQSPAWFYWWLTRLLIERITDFCESMNDQEKSPGRKVRFEFSRRHDLRYSEFTDYMARIHLQEKPFLGKRLPKWSVIDWHQFHDYDPRRRDGLQIADVVASSFYKAVNRTGTTPTPEFAERLKARMWTKNHRWHDEGVTLWPLRLNFLELTDEQKQIFKSYDFPQSRL